VLAEAPQQISHRPDEDRKNFANFGDWPCGASTPDVEKFEKHHPIGRGPIWRDAYAAHDCAPTFGGHVGRRPRQRFIDPTQAGTRERPPLSSRAIISNHGFVDGNKRTLVLTDLLIKRSGYRLQASAEQEDLNLALAA
jgi:hypothetical protein